MSTYTHVPYIQEQYLNRIPTLDPTLYSVLAATEYKCILSVGSDFALMSVLSALYGAFKRDGLSWQCLEVKHIKRRSWTVTISVSRSRFNNQLRTVFLN